MMRSGNMTKSEEIEKLKKRLEMYYQMEENILSGKPVSYGIGSRNLSRYNVSLSEVQSAISKLEEKIKAKEGKKTRRAVSIVPTDY